MTTNEDNMAIQYKKVANNLTTPPFYGANIYAKSVLGANDIAIEINKKIPEITIADAQAVLEGLRDIVKKYLLAGYKINYDGLMTISLSIRCPLTIPTDPIDKNNLSVKGSTSGTLIDDSNYVAEYELIGFVTSGPTIIETLDTNTELHDLIRDSYGFKIVGTSLNFNSANEDEGVFITSPAGNEIRQTNLSVVKPKQIIISPSLDTNEGPAGPASVEQTIAVRWRRKTTKVSCSCCSDPTTSTVYGDLKEIVYSGYPRTINVIDNSNKELFVSGDQTTGPCQVKSYDGDTVLCMMLAKYSNTDVLTMSLALLGGDYGDEITITSAGDYEIPGLSEAVTITIIDFDVLIENVLKYSRYMVDFLQLPPVSDVFWILRESSTSKTFQSVTQNGSGEFVAVSSTSSAQQVAKSATGLSWYFVNTPDDRQWKSIAYNESLDMLLAVSTTGRAMSSVDGGDSWISETPPAYHGLNSVVASGSEFIAVSANLSYSDQVYKFNGTTWSTYNSNPLSGYVTVEKFGTNLLVAASYNGEIMRSTDNGNTWAEASSYPSGYQFVRLRFIESLAKILLTTRTGEILESTDGDTWALSSISFSWDWTDDIEYKNGVGIYVSSDYIPSGTATEDSGIITYRETPVAGSWNCLSSNNDRVVCVGFEGKIITHEI